MKRNAAVLGVSAFALGVLTAAPAAAADAQAQVTEAQSSLGLVGTGAAFLLVGIGSLKIAHRRRWGTVDVRAAGSDEDSLTRSATDRN